MSNSSLPSISTATNNSLNPSELFDVDLFETRLEALKDTQDGIQQMSAWCLQQRANHKRIVASWLNVFKRVRVEHRLTLFYLANDVIQYSKRRRYEFVESWATAIQKATTMVRDEKVKSKILRIFNIWGQREIYNEEYLSDLCGLLNIAPQKKNTQHGGMDSDEYQNASLIANVRDCVELSEITDKSFKKLPKSPDCDIEVIKQQLKDKSHSNDIVHELERYITYIEVFNKNLQTEIKSRKTVISHLDKAIKFYSNQLSEVKVVVAAYKNFGSRIKLVKKRLDEIAPGLPSPLPSPDINAPSPEPDADIELPDDRTTGLMHQPESSYNGYSYLNTNVFGTNDFKNIDGSNTTTSSQSIEVINSRSNSKGFISGTDYYKHESIDNISAYSGTSNIDIPGLNSIPIPTVPSGGYTSLARSSQQYSEVLQTSQSHQSIFNVSGSIVNNTNVSASSDSNTDYTGAMGSCTNFSANSSYGSNVYENNQSGHVERTSPTANIQPLLPPPPIPASVMSLETSGTNISGADDFISAWNLNMNWPNTLNNSSNTINSYGSGIISRNTSLETPLSPPNTKPAPLEYTNQEAVGIESMNNINHHVPLHSPFSSGTKLHLSKEKIRQLDIDHRNLISLTGSPGSNENEKKKWKSSIAMDNAASTGNQIDVKVSEKNNCGIQSNRAGVDQDPSPNMVIDMDMSDEDIDDVFRENNEKSDLSPPVNEVKEINHCVNSKNLTKNENAQLLHTLKNDACSNYGTNQRWNISNQREQLNINNVTDPTVSVDSTDVSQQHSEWEKAWTGNDRTGAVEHTSSVHRLSGTWNMRNTSNRSRDGSFGQSSSRPWNNQHRSFSSRTSKVIGGSGFSAPPFYNRGSSRHSGHSGILRASTYRTKTRGKNNWI